jgi:uncharacterized protein (TIGR00369 family)
MTTWSDRLPKVQNVHDTLGITATEVTPDRVVLTLNVTPAVHQPFGIMHGGVSALLAEGAASIGGVVSVAEDEIVVGTELNCSHLRPVKSGEIRAIATPIRKGRTVHVWAIEIRDDRDRLVCTARCSLQVLKAPQNGGAGA